MFLPIVPLKVLRVLGLDDSDLGDRARAIAQSQDVKVQPDPEPLRKPFRSQRPVQLHPSRSTIRSEVKSTADEVVGRGMVALSANLEDLLFGENRVRSRRSLIASIMVLRDG